MNNLIYYKSQNKNSFDFNKFYLFFFFIISCNSVLAQTDFRPGYYITLENDTVHGLIDYRGEVRNSKFCEFKENENSETIRFEPTHIKAYRFNDSKFYISRKINIDNSEQQVFLEFLVNGISNLYFYVLSNNSMYFIENQNGELIELKNDLREVYKEGEGHFQKQSLFYIGQLKATFADCKEIQVDLNKSELSHNSLINLVKDYHNYVCDDEQCVIYEKPVPILNFRIAPIIGVSTTLFHFDKLKFSNYNFNQNYYPFLGIILNTSIPRINEKLSLDIELNTGKSEYYGNYIKDSGSIIEYHEAFINLLNLQSSASIKYTFPRGKLRPTLAVGATSNIFISKDQRFIRESKRLGIIYTFETYDSPLASIVNGLHLQIGCNYTLPGKQTIFANIKLSNLVKREVEVKNLIQAYNLSFGIFLAPK